MTRKLIGGLAAVAALAAAAVIGSSGLTTASETRPAYSSMTIDLGKGARAHARKAAPSSKKPKLVYLQGTTTTINPADVSAGGLGPYIDIGLTGCSKVVDGGVVPKQTNDVFVQGSYVESPSEYHVLIGIDDAALATRAPFTITSNLTCLKGVK